MGIQKQLLPLFMLLLSSNSSYSILQEDPSPSTYLNEASVYNTHAYPTYFSTINDGDKKFEPIFRNLINYEKTEISALEQLDQVGSSATSVKVVNVDDYGAKGDGRDDTEAFKKAWKVACSSSPAVVVVPQNKNYLLKPITFSGPCKSDLTMMVYGTIEASDDRADYESDRQHWLVFENIQNLIVEGGGIINGNGNIWWQNSCKVNKKLPCKSAPTALTFLECKNLLVRNLKIKDSQQIHVEFENCVTVQAFNLMITAPENSPNTDGIHVTGTQNILIKSCVIKTGDDCISIVSGSSKVQASDITCGPGHGISIGSLGAGNEEAHVSDVIVDRARLSGTTNGVRIKTWPGGSGSANNIIFQNIAMYNVTNPIIIDQNYCDEDEPCKELKSAVQVKQVMYKNIKGTSASEVAVKFDCSKSFPCFGISLQDINLVSVRGRATTSCENVKWTQIGSVSPTCP
ncbi:polygalacturonase isoform X2 [Telopea speciosissima]|uniref:polygalacturonase isoform X2 n=1 Tax=Telopea speciosissima TaxID=54955 RepID=UPI001CC4C9D5|nr:polygalacturonase isoform X2 [Telopea speciosissima]